MSHLLANRKIVVESLDLAFVIIITIKGNSLRDLCVIHQAMALVIWQHNEQAKRPDRVD